MPCYIHRECGQEPVFICGELGPHCGEDGCGEAAGYLCDYPVGDEQPCDIPMCSRHAAEVAPNTHYCRGHLSLWREFVRDGGVSRELSNVVPYKQDH